MKNFLFLTFLVAMLASCSPKQDLYLIETDHGTMTVKLYDSTPQHRDNFKKLVEDGFYDDLLFHRVIKEFMVQGGDPNSKGAAPGQRLGNGGPGYTIPAEIGAYHFKGALSAARLPDGANPQKASSGSQFYVVQGKPATATFLNSMAKNKGITYTPEDIARYETQGGTPFLDADYTVFGEVVEGLDVVDKIAAVKTGGGDRPVEDVKMKIRKK